MKKIIFYLAFLTAVSAIGCKGISPSANTDTVYAESLAYKIKPKSPVPAWAPDMKPQMQAVVEKLQSYGDQPIETLGPGRARKNHVPADAVKDLLKDNRIPLPVYNIDTTGKDITAAWGTIHLRMYTPRTRKKIYPAIVYYHGGGFVIAGINAYDVSAKILAVKTGAVVVSVGYRLAPQYKFPYAHNDALRAYAWVLKNAATIKCDSTKIAVAGEDAGANLAINTALKAKLQGLRQPVAVLAIYPIAGSSMNTPSYLKNADAIPLNKPMMAWFYKKYLNKPNEARDPQINLVSANLKGLPPTIVITAEIDPLQSEGLKLVDKLKADGVTVYSKNYDGVTHEFFGMGAIVPEAKDAEQFAADQLKKTFGM
ncbi:MAG: alpha/beta hydrolase [Mucilaginibacter sp.]